MEDNYNMSNMTITKRFQNELFFTVNVGFTFDVIMTVVRHGELRQKIWSLE